jgi:putative transposase
MCEPHGRAFTVGSDHVVFPKLGKIEAVIHRPLGGKQKAITITRDADEWYASVMCEVEIADPVLSTKPTVGIDRGVVNLLADSDGRMVPADLTREAKMRTKIAHAQRVIARRKKGSKNRQKAIDRLARIHQTQRRQREHVLHVESCYYAQNYGVIVIERLNVRGMTVSAAGTTEEPGTNVRQKAGLNRSILASGWGKFAEMAKYKVIPEGASVIERDPAYSSCECSACGVVDKASRRTQSEFCCTGCGHAENADTNAAKVMKKRGCTAAEHAVAACGGTGKTRPLKQERRSARTTLRPKSGEAAMKRGRSGVRSKEGASDSGNGAADARVAVR